MAWDGFPDVRATGTNNKLGLWADALHGSTRLHFLISLLCIVVDSL